MWGGLKGVKSLALVELSLALRSPGVELNVPGISPKIARVAGQNLADILLEPIRKVMEILIFTIVGNRHCLFQRGI